MWLFDLIFPTIFDPFVQMKLPCHWKQFKISSEESLLS